MARISLLLAAAGAASAQLDCAMRQLTLDYAGVLQPFRSATEFQLMSDSLSAASTVIPENNGTACSLTPPAGTRAEARHTVAGAALYVSPSGSDSSDGSRTSPFATIAHAISVAGNGVAVVLMDGVFYQNGSTVALSEQHSGLQLVADAGAAPVVSGGTLLQGLTWVRYGAGLNGSSIWQADLSGYAAAFPASIYGLRSVTTGSRLPRARYPNIQDIDTQSVLDTGIVPDASVWWPHTNGHGPDVEIRPAYPYRDDIALMQHYQIGVGGVCSQLEPPMGFWCGNLTDREANGTGYLTYPSGVTLNSSVLPNLPRWSNPDGAVLLSWHQARWFSVAFGFSTGNVTRFNGGASANISFAVGGWQGSRGYSHGSDISVENVFEELDATGEWFYNVSTRQLYVVTATGSPPADSSLVAVSSTATVLLNVSGSSQSSPVTGVTISGITLTDAAYTYLSPHGQPSGGDWTLARTAALFVANSEELTVSSCTFTRLDNNALFLSGYARNATIANNTFSYLGENAIALWGYAGGVPEAPGMGWDLRTGEQPRFTRITQNLCHHIGIWQKQSACVFQAEAGLTYIGGNIFFDTPRAAINENDLGMGGSLIEANAIWSTCKETADHGNFNSWSRTARVNDLHPDGSPGAPATTVPLWTQARKNLWIGGSWPPSRSGFLAGVQECFDTDDGSAYVNVTGNVFLYGSSDEKSDLGGHDNRHVGNVVLLVSAGFGGGPTLANHQDWYQNNTVVLLKDGNYGGNQNCASDMSERTVVSDNRIYSPAGKVTECSMTLAQWQAKSPQNDPRTTAAPYPADLAAAAVQWARALLGM